MGVRILHDREENIAALYCSTSDVAFGPLFMDGDDHMHDAVDRAEAFLRWLKATPVVLVTDPRQLSEGDLMQAYSLWLAQEPAQYQAEVDEADAKYAEDDEIEALRAQAETSGNDLLAKQCELALQGDVPARAACYRASLQTFIGTMKVMEG